jgi:flagellar protein FliS
MTMTAMLNTYKEDAIISAPKEKLLLMLYDGALKNLKRAVQMLEENNGSSFGVYIGKGQAIVAELLNSLNHEVGGEISKNLERLYLYIIDRLLSANLNRKTDGIHESIQIMSTLKEGWEHAVQKTCGQLV